MTAPLWARAKRTSPLRRVASKRPEARSPWKGAAAAAAPKDRPAPAGSKIPAPGSTSPLAAAVHR
eukprot:7933384-Alexandrium_andersonii.AAC.1